MLASRCYDQFTSFPLSSFLYVFRAVVSDERNAQAVAVAEAVLTNAATAPGKSSSTQGPHSMRIVAAAIAGILDSGFPPPPFFGPFSRISQLHAAAHTPCAILLAPTASMVIGACNPALCRNHVFRAGPGGLWPV